MTCIYFGLDIFVGLIILKSIYVFLFFFIPKIFKKMESTVLYLKNLQTENPKPHA